MTTRDIATFLLAALATFVSPPAHAVPLTCERALTKESARYVQAALKARQTCEDRKVWGTLPAATNCVTDPATSGRIQTAHSKLLANVAKACGGADKTCGTADDDPLASIGWGAVTTCPNFENGACANPITHCGDVATCLACVDDAVVAQANTLYYAALAQSQFGTHSTVNRCQRAIGKEGARFLRSKSTALRKCWDARLRGAHANPCPVPGDGKAGPAIQKAEFRVRDAICKACGGPNTFCGGGDDLSTSDIGFTASCPDVTVPGGAACASSIDTVTSLAGCVDCVTEYKTDCADALAVPAVKAYPGECNPTTTTTSTTTTTVTTTSTSTTTSTTTTLPTCQRATAPVGQLVFTISPGAPSCGGPALVPPPTAASPPAAAFAGEIDDANGAKLADLGTGCLYFGAGNGHTFPASRIPDGAKPVLDVASASGSALQLAGSAGTGPADCTRGSGPALHCIDGSPGTDTLGACASDGDCSGVAGSCSLDANCIFGPPIPVPIASFPSLSVCIVNVVAQDVCGSADLLSGSSTLSAALEPRIYLTSNGIASPCPRCVANVCTGGDRSGMACSGGVGAESTSIECPPVSALYAGRLSVALAPLGTGTTTALADGAGNFCPGQLHPGAFGRLQAAKIRVSGAPLLSGGIGNPFATTLAGTFCVPATGNLAIDSVADLPAAGAVSIPGTATVSSGLLP